MTPFTFGRNCAVQAALTISLPLVPELPCSTLIRVLPVSLTRFPRGHDRLPAGTLL